MVEDDLTLSEMYSDRLKPEGFSVITAKDGEEAINLIDTAKPSLIILDIMLPKMNGIDVMEKIKASDETKSIPVIIVTALIQEITKIRELMGPRDSYLIKSEIMPGEIVDHIKKVLMS